MKCESRTVSEYAFRLLILIAFWHSKDVPSTYTLAVSCVISMTIHFIAGRPRRFFVIISFMQTLLKSMLVMLWQSESYLDAARSAKTG